VDDDELLSIGEFARRTRLTPKALRIYDRHGLLTPALTDDATGYRRYGTRQIRTGQLIGLLRGADVSLADIQLVLDDFARSGELAIRRLDALLAELARRHTDRQLLIHHVQSTLNQGDDPMFPIHVRHVPAQRVMSVQRRLYGHETSSFVREAKKGLRRPPARSGRDRSVHAHLPRRRRRRARWAARGGAAMPSGDPARREDRDPHRAGPRRGVHDHHEGPMGLPGDPCRL
jgi:DNA-binding transcriptional MerR regulator